MHSLLARRGRRGWGPGTAGATADRGRFIEFRRPPIIQNGIEGLDGERCPSPRAMLLFGIATLPGPAVHDVVTADRGGRRQALTAYQPSHLLPRLPQHVAPHVTERQLQRTLTPAQFVDRFEVGEVGRVDVPHLRHEAPDLCARVPGGAVRQERAYYGPLEDVLDGQAQHLVIDHHLVVPPPPPRLS